MCVIIGQEIRLKKRLDRLAPLFGGGVSAAAAFPLVLSRFFGSISGAQIPPQYYKDADLHRKFFRPSSYRTHFIVLLVNY
jgi:hypothetical protein